MAHGLYPLQKGRARFPENVRQTGPTPHRKPEHAQPKLPPVPRAIPHVNEQAGLARGNPFRGDAVGEVAEPTHFGAKMCVGRAKQTSRRVGLQAGTCRRSLFLRCVIW